MKDDKGILLVQLKDLKEPFRKYCKENHTTMSQELRSFVKRRVKK